MFRNRLNGFDDVRVAGTATQIAGQSVSDFFFARLWILVEEIHRAHEKPGCAETALERMVIPKGLLQRMHLITIGKPLKRLDFRPIGLNGKE